MASYHYDKSKGCMVKCNTADPNGVCRIHGNTDVKADTADEAQRKFNAMKIDEANAEDMSEMPLEYVTEVWKIHCDSINEGNDDGMGPKTIDAIANKPGIWESLDANAADMLAESANSINDDVKNTVTLRFGHPIFDYRSFMYSAPKWVLRMNGYKPATDVLDDISEYFGAYGVTVNEVEYSAKSAWDEYDEAANVADGVVWSRVMQDEDGNLWLDKKISDETKRQCFDDYAQERHERGYLGDGEGYMNSEQYQQDKSDYYNEIGLSL